MRRVRRILAIALIAILLITLLIESAAHAGGPDCVGAQCLDHVPNGDTDLAGHAHEGPDGNQMTHNCCDQIFCQAVALTDYPQLAHPIALQPVSWDQIGQLAAVDWARTPERPPNI